MEPLKSERKRASHPLLNLNQPSPALSRLRTCASHTDRPGEPSLCSWLLSPLEAGEHGTYLAGIKMPNDLNNDLVVLIRGLVSWHYHFSSSQVLQLIHLGVGQPELSAPAMKCTGAEGNSVGECFD